jgi:hypothetical protein
MALDTFFNGFGYFFTIFLWVWNGFGQNRTKIVILAKKTILGALVAFTILLRFFMFFFYDFGTLPYEKRKKIVNFSSFWQKNDSRDLGGIYVCFTFFIFTILVRFPTKIVKKT